MTGKQIVKGMLGIPLASLLRTLKPVSRAMRQLLEWSSARSQLPGLGADVQIDGPIEVLGSGNVTIGPGSRIGAGVVFETSGAGRIRIGRNARINRGTVIVALSGVEIGDWCLIGEYTSIRDANHDTHAAGLIRNQPGIASLINIGSDVWIGRGCCVLKGVTLGDGAVVGANSVVTSDLPPMCIAVGAPARVIGTRVSEPKTGVPKERLDSSAENGLRCV